MSVAIELPTWDMEVVFPSLQSPEFEAEYSSVISEIDRLAEYLERHRIGRTDGATADDEIVRTFDRVLGKFNILSERLQTLVAYVSAFVSTDSRDTLAQAKRSELQQQYVKVSQISTRFTAWIGSLDVEELIRKSEAAQEHAFMLRRTKKLAEHLMEPALEDLAAELEVVGGSAWSRLHDDITSQIMVPFDQDGKSEAVPMTVIRNFAYNEDREVRRRAYEAELEAWKRVDVPLAAALNSIKGETNLLGKHREWASPLDMAIFGNNIDKETLDAMMEAARRSFPDFRRYLRAKARVLGVETCAWYDIFAPIGETSSNWDFYAGRDFLVEQFKSYSERLSGFVDRAFRENWIDAAPRPGKSGGAFCMGLRADESRILANFVPSYDGVSTLAHELGHAYHNFCKASRTPMQKRTPMTLAETASIFCETIIQGAAIARADQAEQIAILESSLQNSCQLLLDISSRFLFESRLCNRREARELSVDELCELMLETQHETYGDSLDPACLHPYMWAVKGHYYGATFYNFPYMFGFLFGLGLYAQYERDPERFKGGYDDLLSSTGMDDAGTLAARFDIDIHSIDFWSSSLDVTRRDIDHFEQLVGAA
jgi:pepF/M3 family oligoendopeptidase